MGRRSLGPRGVDSLQSYWSGRRVLRATNQDHTVFREVARYVIPNDRADTPTLQQSAHNGHEEERLSRQLSGEQALQPVTGRSVPAPALWAFGLNFGPQ